MNSLRLSPHFISSILRDFTGKTTAYKSCVTLYSAKLVPRLFRAQQKNFFSNTFATVGDFQQLLQSFVSVCFSQHDRTKT